MTNEETLRRELENLKAENAKLRDFNTLLQAQRKEYLDLLCGPPDKYALTEEEMAEQMKDLVPLSKFLADVGISRQGKAS